MKLFLFAALIFWFCCDDGYGLVFDPYSRRYNIRNSTFESIFSPSTVATTSIQALVTASTKIDNDRCKQIHQYAVRPTLDQLVSFQYELTELCPQLFEVIRSKNITTWGPVEEFLQIWYMRYVDALWKQISLKLPSGSCALYEDFIAAAENDLDMTLLDYLQNNYNPLLCEVSDQTMREWHLFFQRTQIFGRITKFLKIGSFSIQLIQAIAKAYLTEARYNSYLIGPPYPLITYLNASLTQPNSTLTLTQKGFIKQVYVNLETNFQNRDLVGRQNYFIMKFSETIDLSWIYFGVFNGIQLDALDGISHYHLILYFCRKSFLLAKQLQYVPPPPTIPPPTIPTTPLTCPTTPTNTACPYSNGNNVEVYLAKEVLLDTENGDWIKIEPLGRCGDMTYYDGNTPSEIWEENSTDDVPTAGFWNRTNCPNPCICTASSCYVPTPPGYDFPTFPRLFLYPHCNSPTDCFMAAMFWTNGNLVNPINGSDIYWPYIFIYSNVDNERYPKVTKVGCSGCPVVI